MFRMRYSLFMFLVITFPLFAQDEEGDSPNLEIGIQAGAYLANPYPAVFYNGNNGYYSLYDLLQNQFVYNQIFNKIQLPFRLSELPLDIRYRPGIMAGVHLGRSGEYGSGWFLDLSFVDLRVNDAFVLEADDPNNTSGSKRYFTESIQGKEQRFMMDLGATFYYSDNGYFNIGGNLNAVKAVSNIVVIEGLQYNLLIPQQGFGGSVSRGGLGFGALAGTGFRYPFNEKFTFDLEGRLYLQRINLRFSDSSPLALKLSPQVFLRILFNN